MMKKLTIEEWSEELKKHKKKEAGGRQNNSEPIKSEEKSSKSSESIVKSTEIHKKGVGPDTKQRILVIDDDEIDRMILEKILEQAGYEVLLAIDGKEGMEIFRTQPFDLVITDMIMPEKLGIEVLLEMNEDFPEAKVIAISAGDEFGLELDLDMARIIDVPTISKPFRPEEILDAVRKLLR